MGQGLRPGAGRGQYWLRPPGARDHQTRLVTCFSMASSISAW